MKTEPIIEVPLKLISSDQKNKKFSGVEVLAESIKKEGFFLPISVRINPNKKGEYIVNLGEKRYRAAIALGLYSIPVYVQESTINTTD